MPCVSFVGAVVELKGFVHYLAHIPSVEGPILSLPALLSLPSKFRVLTMSEDSTARSSPLILRKGFVSTFVTFRRRVSLLKE